MTAPTPPALDCPTNTPTGPNAAPQPVDTAAVGEPKGAARKGVPTGSDPHGGDGRRPIAWLHAPSCTRPWTSPTPTVTAR
ncbi:hypothetical protein ACWDZW_43385, partial [Streptomyces coeruleorubidus]